MHGFIQKQWNYAALMATAPISNYICMTDFIKTDAGIA